MPQPVIWNSDQAAEATDGQMDGGKWEASGVSIDTRSLQKGDLFVAIAGENFDGHDFVGKAAKAGAAAAIVSRQRARISGIPADFPLLIAGNTLQALDSLAMYKRKHTQAKIIAITGSVGKTSVKNMLGFVLAQQGKTHTTSGNLNNHIGLPLTMARMPDDCEYGVFELGMNHAGELEKLSSLLQPDIALITAIAPAHMEFFASLEDVAKAKAEIFHYMKKGGTAIVPYDTPFLPVLANTARGRGAKRVITFGKGKRADFQMSDCIAVQAAGGCSQKVNATADNTPLSYTLGMQGKHQAVNSIAVLATVSACGADMAKAAESLSEIEPVDGRGKIHKLQIDGKQFTLIDDSYNASPESMRAGLKILGEMKAATGNHAIAALGDMLELGEKEIEYHQQLEEDISSNDIDKVFTAGKLIQHLYNTLPKNLQATHCQTATDLLPVLKEHIQNNDIILIKGSHGSNMWQIAEALQSY